MVKLLSDVRAQYLLVRSRIHRVDHILYGEYCLRVDSIPLSQKAKLWSRVDFTRIWIRSSRINRIRPPIKKLGPDPTFEKNTDPDLYLEKQAGSVTDPYLV